MSTRTPKHARDARLENEIGELNAMLEPAELAATRSYSAPKKPIVFIVGGARSGSTLALQALASSGLFGYPSNFMSRFPAAPYLLARIQRLYSEMDVLGEFPEFERGMDFSSLLGKTRGVLAPHEFWYFWRRYFHFPDPMSERTGAVVLTDREILLRELAGMEAVFQRPLLFKGSIFSWNIPLIASIFPKALFLHVTRDPVTQGASLLKARRVFSGDETHWYSWKIPDFERLQDLSPIEQVVGQAMSVDASVATGVRSLEQKRFLLAPYEELCGNPQGWLSRVGTWLRDAGIPVPKDFQNIDIDIRRTGQLLEPQERVALEAAHERLRAKYPANAV